MGIRGQCLAGGRWRGQGPPSESSGGWAGVAPHNGVGREGPLHTPGSKGSWRVNCHCILPGPSDSDTELLAVDRVKGGRVHRGALPCPAALPRC